MSLKNIGLYIIHDPARVEREIAYKTIVETVGLEPHMIWFKPASYLTHEDLSRCSGPISKSELSLILNHEHILQDIVAKGYDYAFVIEDDSFTCNHTVFQGFIEHLKHGRLDNAFHTCYIGAGCTIEMYDHIKLPSPSSFILIPTKSSRCTEAIVYSQRGAKVIVEQMKQQKFDKPLDHWFNKIYEDLTEPYVNTHLHPYVIVQGTLLQQFPSTIFHTH